MTYAAVPSLRAQPELAREWLPRLAAPVYDPRFAPAAKKQGALAGMAMTEKQGGSDVRANRTRADPVDGGRPGGLYRITGHKWFCSAPMSDVFLVLAQAPSGLSCFLLPRWLPDGNRNAFHLLVGSGHPAVADAFCASRLAGDWGRALGNLPRGTDVPAILERAHPKTV